MIGILMGGVSWSIYYIMRIAYLEMKDDGAQSRTKIAILEAKVDHMMGHVKELTQRVRANEKVVASVSLLGVIACTVVGAGYFAPRAEAYPQYLEPQTQQPYSGMLSGPAAGANEWISKMRQWELEQSMTDPEFDINNALAEYFNNGSDDLREE